MVRLGTDYVISKVTAKNTLTRFKEAKVKIKIKE